MDLIGPLIERAGGWPVVVTAGVCVMVLWIFSKLIHGGYANCPQCGVRMKKKSTVTGKSGGCLMMLVGLLLFLFLPVVGWVIGPVIILLGIFGRTYRRALWRCPKCKLAFDR